MRWSKIGVHYKGCEIRPETDGLTFFWLPQNHTIWCPSCFPIFMLDPSPSLSPSLTHSLTQHLARRRNNTFCRGMCWHHFFSSPNIFYEDSFSDIGFSIQISGNLVPTVFAELLLIWSSLLGTQGFQSRRYLQSHWWGLRSPAQPVVVLVHLPPPPRAQITSLGSPLCCRRLLSKRMRLFVCTNMKLLRRVHLRHCQLPFTDISDLRSLLFLTREPHNVFWPSMPGK